MPFDLASDPVFAAPTLTGRQLTSSTPAVPTTPEKRTAGIYLLARSLRALLGLPEVRKATDRMTHEVDRRRGDGASRYSIAIGSERVRGEWCSTVGYGSVVEHARVSLYLALHARVVEARDRVEGGELSMCPTSLPGMVSL